MPSWMDRFRSRPTPSGSPEPPRPDPRAPLHAGRGRGDATTQLHSFGHAILGALVVDLGPAPLRGLRFVLRGQESRIGRGRGCEIQLDDPRISREHASLIPQEPGGLVLEHRSRTNPTFVNGELVSARCTLQHGDHILVAEDILLRLDAPLLQSGRPRDAAGTLQEAMEERIQLEARIRERFVRDGSFLDIDIVDSYGLKQGVPPDRIVVSFERFRRFVGREIEAHDGRLLNSNGDEVMCYFESAERALAAARAIQKRMAEFNAGSNLLTRPFAVRVGIDSGRCAVDLDRGIAYSPILDGAGHLQKAAPPGGVLLSDATRSALTDVHGDLEAVEGAGKSQQAAWLVRPPTA